MPPHYDKVPVEKRHSSADHLYDVLEVSIAYNDVIKENDLYLLLSLRNRFWVEVHTFNPAEEGFYWSGIITVRAEEHHGDSEFLQYR